MSDGRAARMPTGKVLVLGDDTRSFLSVVRSLGRKALTVDIAWCPASAPAAQSRFIRARHELPAFSTESDAWKTALMELLDREDYDLVIPCNDQSILPLQHHREDFRRFPAVPRIDPDTFADVFDKVRTNKLAASLGINLPAELILTEEAQLTGDALRDMGFPLVLKPKSSFSVASLHKKSHVAKVRDSEGLMRQGAAMLKTGAVQVQKNFRGTGEGVEVLAGEGEILFAFQHRRLHEPPGGGGSSYRVSVPLDPRLLDAARKLMRRLDYTGVAMVEFKIDHATGDWILIEINGRFWGSLPLALAAGADFPFYYYQHRVHGRTAFDAAYAVGMRSRNLENDVEWVLQNLRPEGREEEYNPRPLRSILRESLGLFTGREHYDTLVSDDPLPGLGEIRGIVRGLYERVSRKLRLRIWDAGPVRALLRLRMLARFRSARNVLFVCKGNICRSPFAEALARQRFPAGCRLASSGYYPVSGRPSPWEAVACARAFGAELEAHRSHPLAAEAIALADVIFVFDPENFSQVRALYPAAAGKVFPLALADASLPLDIADPFGGTPEDYRATYAAIDRCVTALAEVRR